MEKNFDPISFEPYWQQVWQKTKIYEPNLEKAKKPFYNLMMFPYPSAEGLHVGNVYAFCGADIYGRFMRMRGYDVFEPIGLDGFGIHSENYALKINKHPKEVAKRTEVNFYRQLHATGNAFDWSHKLETYDANYYKWTQWIFIQMFKAGLAYRAKADVNWCPSCLTVLADEQVVPKRVRGPVTTFPPAFAKASAGRPASSAAVPLEAKRNGVGSPSSRATPHSLETISVCERCGSEVEKKELSQWFFRITAYAQRLLDDLDKLDWSEKVKIAQRNWLGRSEGVLIKFRSDIERDSFIEVFTTRQDTIYGVTYLALAPEHPSVPRIIDKSKGLLRRRIQQYVDYSKSKSTEDRQTRSKTGIKTGFHGVNPLSGEKIPIFIADYVLLSYGTGAIMGVPAHDQRDFEFAKEQGLEIIEVVAGGDIKKRAFEGEGTLINSKKYNGLSSNDSIQRITYDIKRKHIGTSTVTWHLRDWIISRQRYWGPPIPIIYCRKCWEVKSQKLIRPRPSRDEVGKVKSLEGKDFALIDGVKQAIVSVPEADLPVELPYIKNFKPTGTGVSPLAQDPNFVKVKCPQCLGEAKRETDVSDTFLDSAWYFLRYLATDVDWAPFPSKLFARGPVSSFPPVSARSKLKSKRDQRDNVELRAVGIPARTATPRKRFNNWKMANGNSLAQRAKWLPVDMYIGGAEHAVLHLLYSRFLWKVFYDLGYFDFSAKSPRGHLGGPAKMSASGWEEPFAKFRAHGLLISKGAKMSKSRGNIVTPDAYIEKYGADTLRCYLMFCGRFTQGGDFRDEGIEGMSRFLRRVWRLVAEATQNYTLKNAKGGVVPRQISQNSAYFMHKTIKRVTEDIESLDYNTALAALMEWVNALEARTIDSEQLTTDKEKSSVKCQVSSVSLGELQTLLLLLAPFAPHMTEELWQQLRTPIKADKNQRTSADANWQKSARWSVHQQPWPKYNPKLAEASMIVLVVQVNGKVRDRLTVDRGISRKMAEQLALQSLKVTKYLQNKRVKRVIFVPDRLVNLVI